MAQLNHTLTADMARRMMEEVLERPILSRSTGSERTLSFGDIMKAAEKTNNCGGEIRFSEHATAAPKEPRTDYMRQMVAHVGVQRVPACYKMKLGNSEVIVAHTSMKRRLGELS